MPICPSCGREYTDHPAVSRKDNITEICPDCGVIEALEAVGASQETIDSILKRIHATRKEIGIE